MSATANSRRTRTPKAKPTTSPYGPRRRPGRPTKLTYELGDRIIELIGQGVYIEVAARACGVSKPRFYDWSAKAAEYDDATEEELEQLDDETAMFVWFRYAYQIAEAEAEARLLLNARQARQHWQAHMTILERRFPSRWRRREEMDVTHAGEVAVTPLSPEERERELAAFGMPAALAVAAGPDAIAPPPDA